MFQIRANKAHGWDGYFSLFYQTVWKEVGKEVCDMVQEFFQGKSYMQPINSTNIVLIPKVEKPKGVHHFKTIDLCHVLYKIIAKVLTSQ